MESQQLEMPNQVDVAICRDICARFVERNESTGRLELVKNYRNTEILQQLREYSCFLEGIGSHPGIDDAYVPRLGAFVLAADEDYLRLVRSGMLLAVRVMLELFLESSKPREGFSFDEMLTRARLVDPSVSERTLQIGITMACAGGSLGGSYRLNESKTAVEHIYIHETIVNISDPEQWVEGQIQQCRNAIANRALRAKAMPLSPLSQVVQTEWDNFGSQPTAVSDASVENVLAFVHNDLRNYGHYLREGKRKDAVAAAFKRVENRLNEIRDSSPEAGNTLAGVQLPYGLFAAGCLKFPYSSLGAKNEKSREAYSQALKNLLSSGLGWFRNSFEHEPYNLPELDEAETLECLFVASYMLRIIDRCVQSARV